MASRTRTRTNNDGGEKKKEGPSSSKIVKWVKSSQGAESVKSAGQANKLTVVGKVDPTKLRDELATKTKNRSTSSLPSPKRTTKSTKTTQQL
ncbi:heavy metal-associated isoprenylated plant protein 3-like [Prunus yedoensis var. nudiflora]|uniref:Heavy metal-associated isoprenylated plant protein 3-like n=1 Tax=Prunus yedoensis var. nudiflora TaxID=2094558 RepID=A0A314U6B0_PRUYE|nr:heavy metal-associated isoprenylated plant protein 3-like [Prunus yedoensis var. nudiflora]